MTPTQPASAVSEMGVTAPPAPLEAMHTRLVLLAMGLFVLAAWLLEHPYAGVVHDATLYTLMALERLNPNTLSHDIFLRFGSQDQYTLFGPLFAAAIRLVDLEPAAALLTFLSQCAFFGCAWLLARQFVPGTLALLATGLLAVMPSAYGSGGFFHYTENFLTPRLPAEALVLAAIAATFASRYAWAAVCALTALLLHPLIGSAGIAMLASTFVAIPRPRLALGCGALVLVVSLLAAVTGIGPFTAFGPADTQWLRIVSTTSPFLFVSLWSAHDWVRDAVPLAVLTIGLLTATTKPLRNICAGALLTGLGGVLLTAVYCDALKIILVTGAQPWRWLWVTDVIAVLLSPLIARNCWQSGTTARAATILLLSAWVFQDDMATLPTLALAIACAAFRNAPAAKTYARLIFFGSCALLLAATALNLGDKYSTPDPGGANSIGQRVSLWVRIWDSDGVVLGPALVLLWFALERSRTGMRTVPLVMASAIACAALGISAWTVWTASYYTPALRAEFATWRHEIPPQAEVLWPGNPVGAWYLLDRPSYWSVNQSVGAIFSKQKAVVFSHRSAAFQLPVDAPPAGSDDNARTGDTKESRMAATPPTAMVVDRHSLEHACKDPDLGYVVSWSRIEPTPVDPVAPDSHRPGNRLYLYRCADFRG